MSDKRQKNQLVLAFTEEGRSEAPKASQEGTETFTAKCETERPASHEQLMEEVCERGNCWQAYKRVKANKGSPGIDGIKVGELSGYLKQHWPSIREQLLRGTYQPQPVRRVEIPKPDGGMRKLGIPTVLDRFIQQAVMQVLQRRWDPIFSEHSHGFRTKRSAHQAIAKAQQYIAAGHRWVVDLDLEKFFDRVNHDKLMAAIARRITDKRVLRLIGAFLNVGVLENGLVSPAEEGTPQGGPLSPLLSNIVLDELDRELERRRHRFVRYADDRRMRTRMSGRVAGESGRPLPLCRFGPTKAVSGQTRKGKGDHDYFDEAAFDAGRDRRGHGHREALWLQGALDRGRGARGDRRGRCGRRDRVYGVGGSDAAGGKGGAHYRAVQICKQGVSPGQDAHQGKWRGNRRR